MPCHQLNEGFKNGPRPEEKQHESQTNIGFGVSAETCSNNSCNATVGQTKISVTTLAGCGKSLTVISTRLAMTSDEPHSESDFLLNNDNRQEAGTVQTTGHFDKIVATASKLHIKSEGLLDVQNEKETGPKNTAERKRVSRPPHRYRRNRAFPRPPTPHPIAKITMKK
ncbi:unnamed protein product [Caenorhabditis auriculariae]|uniref:Uncharacterized protein n=1 Tax=Caenorhabditis auriculariae TaxID=2777116 RepID=A0A8S1H594_9PELO|nr:unnamed protein product [Caenorhabditis auriculariae]